MNGYKKYHVLWIDDDFREGALNHNVMKQYLNFAKEYGDIDFQTCIYGNDFLQLANQGDPWDWDAFIVDYQGMMEEGGNVRDILAELVEQVKKDQDVLWYCFSGQISEDYPTSEEGYLKSQKFQVNPETRYHFFSKDECDSFFENLHEELKLKYGRFKDYPEFRVLYEEVETEGKVFIESILDWKKNHNTDVDYTKMRFITKPIEQKLKDQGFYGEYEGKSFQGYIDWPPQKNNPDCLSLECRTKWEAQAMAYLFNFANIAGGHPERFGYKMPEPEEEGYDTFNPYIKEMVFDSLAVFSKWYARFERKLKEKGGNMSVFFNKQPEVSISVDNNDYPSVEETAINTLKPESKETEQQKNDCGFGLLAKRMSQKGNGSLYWIIEMSNKQTLLVDWDEYEICERIGECVTVTYSIVFKNGKKLANNLGVYRK